MSALACPNTPPCAHGYGAHVAARSNDLWPMCTVEECRCGHPGTATLYRGEDGTVTVADADPVVRVSRELVADPELGPLHFDDHGQILILDTAGQYRYQLLRTDPQTDDLIYGRVS